MSARWISVSTSSPCSGWHATPIEPPTCSVVASTANGSRSRVQQALRDGRGLHGVGDAVEQDPELVAAQPRDRVAGAQA